jgi:hypothetical protein
MSKTLDPRSDAVVLTFTGEDGVPAAGAPTGTPARDLTENDLASLAYARSLGAVAKVVGTPIDPEDPGKGLYVRPDPRQPDPEVVAALVEELLVTGQYATPGTKPKQSKPAAPAATDETAETAEKPEA